MYFFNVGFDIIIKNIGMLVKRIKFEVFGSLEYRFRKMFD